MPTPTRLLLTAALLAAAPLAHAQCPFTPTITPNNLIMCPNTQDTLRTQAYDAYQWYKDGTPIGGATQRYLVVDQYQDAGSSFSVEARLNNCARRSADVLVDGWVFAGLSVLSGGQFATDILDGHMILCDSNALHPRDSAYFEVMLPYVTNVRWYHNGVLIPGANRPRLTVEASGIYEVEGSPAVCAGYSQRSLPLQAELRRPVPPTIQPMGADLMAVPPVGIRYARFQWFRNGVAVPGATTDHLTPPGPGAYRVQGDDGTCWAVSNVYRFGPTGMAADAPGAAIRLYPNPTTATLTLDAPHPVTATVLTVAGQVVLRRAAATQLDLRALPAGLYFVRLTDPAGQLLKVEKVVKEE